MKKFTISVFFGLLFVGNVMSSDNILPEKSDDNTSKPLETIELSEPPGDTFIKELTEEESKIFEEYCRIKRTE